MTNGGTEVVGKIKSLRQLRRQRLERKLLMLSVYMTCQETYGNGVLMGMIMILEQMMLLIHPSDL